VTQERFFVAVLNVLEECRGPYVASWVSRLGLEQSWQAAKRLAAE
jgi:hypothetical protein